MSKKIAIFGENASALLTGLYFQRAGHQVEIFDRGQHFQFESPRFYWPELSFWPSSEEAFEDLAWLESLLNISLGGVEADQPPVTITNDNPTPFVGFGDKRYKSIPVASIFNRRARLQLNLSEPAVYQRMREQCHFQIREFAEISQIKLSGNGIEAVQVNGSKDIAADAFVFCQNPLELIRMAPSDFFSPRLLSRLARVNVFSQLSLTVQHTSTAVLQQILDGQGLLFLLPNQNDQEPVIGQISDTHTLWTAFLPAEIGEDPELVAGVFKNMRKLVDKHFSEILPSFSEELRRASIHMQPECLAEYPTDEAFEIFKKSNENALLVSPLWSSHPGLPGVVEACRKATAGFQFKDFQKAQPTSLDATT